MVGQSCARAAPTALEYAGVGILNNDLIHPQAAIKPTKNLARELAWRLRDLHKVISDLEK